MTPELQKIWDKYEKIDHTALGTELKKFILENDAEAFVQEVLDFCIESFDKLPDKGALNMREVVILMRDCGNQREKLVGKLKG